MAAVKIPNGLWQHFSAVAQQRRQEPDRLAAKILRDFLERVADEELLRRSARAARGSPFRIGEAEDLVRRYRTNTRKA